MQPKFTVYRPDTTRWHWYVSGIEGNHQSGNCKTKRECKKVFEEMKETTPDLVFERGIDRYVPVIPKVKPGDTIPCYGCYKDIPAANITAEELTAAVCENRLVAIVQMGKGETDFIELRCIGKDSYYLRNIIGRGYSYAKECFPVRGGNFDKAWHVVEVIARQVGADVNALEKLQNLQTIYIK